MKYIERPQYLSHIEKFVDKPIIKNLTGMRRVKKSTILMVIKDEILKHVPDEQKICINFESLEFMSIDNANALAQYAMEKPKYKWEIILFFGCNTALYLCRIFKDFF